MDMNLGPLADMHPVEQAIRDYVDRLTCIEEEGCVKTGAAVLAVLDLHKQQPLEFTATPKCGECENVDTGDYEDYPCKTVKLIADALGVTPC